MWSSMLLPSLFCWPDPKNSGKDSESWRWRRKMEGWDSLGNTGGNDFMKLCFLNKRLGLCMLIFLGMKACSPAFDLVTCSPAHSALLRSAAFSVCACSGPHVDVCFPGKTQQWLWCEVKDWIGTQKSIEIMPIVTIIVINSQDNNHLIAVAMHLKDYSLCVYFFNVLDGTGRLGFWRYKRNLKRTSLWSMSISLTLMTTWFWNLALLDFLDIFFMKWLKRKV